MESKRIGLFEPIAWRLIMNIGPGNDLEPSSIVEPM